MITPKNFWKWLHRKPKPPKGWERGKTYGAHNSGLVVTSSGDVLRTPRSIIKHWGKR